MVPDKVSQEKNMRKILQAFSKKASTKMKYLAVASALGERQGQFNEFNWADVFY